MNNTKCRVLIVSRMHNKAGIENFLINVVRNINIENFCFVFFRPEHDEGPYDKELLDYGCEIEYAESENDSAVSTLCRLYKYLKRNTDFDVIHFHGNTAISCLGAIVAKRYHIPKIIVHSHSNSAGSKKHMILHKLLVPIVERSCTDRFACSISAWEWMFKKNHHVIGKDIIIKNGIDTNKFRFNSSSRLIIRNELKLSETDVIFGFVGRLTKAKNPLFVIDVFKEYKKEHDNSKLLIIGDGELKEDIQARISQYELSDSILLVGFVDNVSDYYSAMDVLLAPSEWEGFGLAILEAQSCGVYCLVSENIVDDVCITSKIKKLSLKLNPRAWAESVSIPIVNDRVKSYKEIIASGFDSKNSVLELEQLYIN